MRCHDAHLPLVERQHYTLRSLSPLREVVDPMVKAENQNQEGSRYTEDVYGRYLTTAYSHRSDLSDEGLARGTNAYERDFGSYLPDDPEAQILEIGCGNGSFLQLCVEKGLPNARGVEISPELVDFCRSRGLENVIHAEALEFLRETPDLFHLIALFDVLEHLPKSRALEVMKTASKRLHPGGRLLVRVPNMSNPLNIQARYGDFTHEVGYSKESLEQLLRVCGLEIESVYGLSGRHRNWLAHIVFDRLLWWAFQVFYRHTMQLKTTVERGKNLVAVASRGSA